MEDMFSYDRIADEFSQSRINFKSSELPVFEELLGRLKPNSRVLDVGCGTGLPVARLFCEHGHRVKGFDLSKSLIQLARKNIPLGSFHVGDMLSFQPQGRFDAVVAWDSVFHIEPSKHAEVYLNFANWLYPEGWLLTSIGGEAGEFTAPMFGHDFHYGGLAPEEARKLIEKQGINIVYWKIDDPSSRGHIAVLGQKIASN